MTQTPHYQGPLLTVYQWEETLPDGSPILFERCVRPDSVAVIPFLDRHTILLVEEAQLGRSDTFVDIPGGRIDAGEDPLTAAKRELREELGYEAAEFLLWEATEYKGLVRFTQSIYLAKGLTPCTTPSTTHDATETITIIPIALEAAVERCLTKNLRRTEATLALLRMEYDPATKQRLMSFLSDGFPPSQDGQ